jgi:AraC-like DNA-binding protein
LYLTLMVPLCQEVMDAARLLWAAPVAAQGDSMAVTHITQLEPQLQAWRHALQAQRPDQARLALSSLLLRLCAQGHTALLAPPLPGFAAQVRAIVTAQPAREWRSRDFEDALGLSGATLRRRLSAEQTTLSEVIVHARLAQAMELLYTTRWPIKTIAARVGYRSPASFSRRFAQRYGLEPGEIGNAV